MTTRQLFIAFGCSALLYSTLGAAAPIDLFLERVDQGQIVFLGIEPGNLGDPNAPPSVLAQVEDTDGTLGSITANSPDRWRWFGKGLAIVGTTAGGALGGASAGAGALGFGAVPGAIIGGGFGLLASVGTAIVANTSPPVRPPAVLPPPPTPPLATINPSSTQDVAIYNQIIVDTATGNVDLAAAITFSVLGSSGLISHLLPGGGTMFEPDSSLFAGSNILNAEGVPLPDGEVGVAVIDVDGSLSTALDQTVAVIFQDLVRGIHPTDQVSIFLDNVVSPGLLADGDPVISRHMFAITVPEPSTLAVSICGLGILGLIASLRYRRG